MNTTILAIEQGGSALRLVNQNNGYIAIVYKPKTGLARTLSMFEETCYTEAREEFEVQCNAFKEIGMFGPIKKRRVA